jgi:DNA-directed RNA polymerase subunit omega
MIYPSADILDKWGSKYALVTLAAKRAKQLKAGAPPMVETESRNALTIALEEIAAGKITSVVANTDEPVKPTEETQVSGLFAIPHIPDEEELEELEYDVEDEIPLVLGGDDEDEVEENETDELDGFSTEDEDGKEKPYADDVIDDDEDAEEDPEHEEEE